MFPALLPDCVAFFGIGFSCSMVTWYGPDPIRTTPEGKNQHPSGFEIVGTTQGEHPALCGVTSEKLQALAMELGIFGFVLVGFGFDDVGVGEFVDLELSLEATRPPERRDAPHGG
jgi:hypothetical protein